MKAESAVIKMLRIQARVIGALMLRDVQTRFGGRSANYLIAIAWPLSHISILLLIYSFAGRSAPIGQSAPLFFATGLVPFVMFNYPSRQMMLALTMNAPLLNFPIVTTTDVLFSRAILETVTSFAVVMIFAAILYGLGVDIMPRYPETAVTALCATLFLSISVGIVNSVIQIFVKVWMIGYILVMIISYITSGILFVPEFLPEKIRSVLLWNPLLQAVEWFRTAYFEGYGRQTLDKQYVVITACVLLAGGLTAERFTRRYAQFG